MSKRSTDVETEQLPTIHRRLKLTNLKGKYKDIRDELCMCVSIM